MAKGGGYQSDDSAYLDVTGIAIGPERGLLNVHKENERLQKLIETLRKQVDDKADRFAVQEQKLKVKRRKDLKEKEKEMDDLKRQVKTHEGDKRKMNDELQNAELEIIRKPLKLEDSQCQVNQLETQLNTLQQNLNKFKEKERIPSTDERYQTQMKELEHSKLEIETLKTKLQLQNIKWKKRTNFWFTQLQKLITRWIISVMK